MLPFALRTTTGDLSHDTYFDVTSVEVFAEAPEGTLVRPASQITDVDVLGGGASVKIPFEAANNHTGAGG